MTTASKPCSDRITPNAWAGRLIVLEGMPGAGKTTAAGALAELGSAVVGEYTDDTDSTIAVSAHPAVDDDDAHQRNWLGKAAQCSARLDRHPVVYADRDWLSSLSYAYSTAPGDSGELLCQRAAWVARHLAAGALLLPGAYVLFDLDPATSVIRRAGRLRPGHPWNEMDALVRLRAFYRDPAGAIRPVNSELADALALPSRLAISGRDDPLATLGLLISLAKGTR